MTVSLRPIVEGDLERIRKWLERPDVVENIRSRTVTASEQREWFQHYCRDATKRVFAIEVEGRHIGNISLFDIDSKTQSASLTIFVGEPEYRGSGIGTSAMRELFAIARRSLLNRITLEVLATNLPAIRCYEKVGMKVIGRAEPMIKMAIDLTDHQAG